ncbi:MAG: hypothetical protein HFE45_03655 [Oscillospiraceae bacterium]|nr:hypothetical protein [Oscillospiraceae bacterium]
MKKQRSGFFLFSLSFLVTLAILILAMALILSASAKNRPAAPEPSSDLSAQSYHPSSEDAFRVLVIYRPEPDADPKGFALLAMDPVAVKVILLNLPAELSVTLDGRTDTLAGHTAYAGGGEALRAAEALLQTPVDRWVLAERRGAINLIDALGGMEWEFSEPLKTQRLSVPVGRHLLDGETVLTLLEDSENEALPDTVHAAAGLLGQRLTESLLNNGDWFFQILISNTEGNISQFDYQTRKKQLRWYLANDQRRLQTLSVTGETDAEGTLWLSEKDRALLQAELGKYGPEGD